MSEWFFSKVGTTTGVGTVRWKKFTIQELIIPAISQVDELFFEEQVQKYIVHSIDIQYFTSSVNKRIYNIVGLSEEEISFVENYYPAML